MVIKDLYEKKIERKINPAVVVGEETQETLVAEIHEYVITPLILEKAWAFLQAVSSKKSGKAGIWINGYYGSGKSHFIKFMHYCLHPLHREVALDKIEAAVKDYDPFSGGANEQITFSNFQHLRKKLSDTTCEDIMFNVEAATDSHPGERLTRIFLNMLNQFRGYNESDIPLALLLEKPLDKAGLLDQFKKAIQEELNIDWLSEAANLKGYYLQKVLAIAKKIMPDLDTIALHNVLNNEHTYHIGISSKLIPELKDFIASKGDNYRLIFLVDEISQYIGQNKDILLNLQSIVEEVSHHLKNQVWIALTAQQTLEDVVSRFENPSQSDGFGKILGRFESDNRISLEGTDASYITRKRVLDKNSEGIKELASLYQLKKDAIHHQFKLGYEFYQGFQDQDDFVLTYPFVPYQFRLIADVFNAFQASGYVIKEVKDNQRSILGVTHFTAKKHAQETVGNFIAFDFFFNEILVNNLTQTGGRIINRVLDVPFVKADAFSQRVVKALFMISNLEQSLLSRFKPGVENLSVLLMTLMDENKLNLQSKTRKVLEKLKDENLIREENGAFFFYSEDEIKVTNEIKEQVITNDDRLTLINELFISQLNVAAKVAMDQNDIRIAYSVDDKEIYRNGDVKINFLIYEPELPESKCLTAISNDLYFCISEWFLSDETFRKDTDWFTKSTKYIRNNSAAATSDRERTLSAIKERDKILKEKLQKTFALKFETTRIISKQLVVDADKISGTKPSERFKNALDFHLKALYQFMGLAAGYSKTASELRTKVAGGLQPEFNPSPAEQKIEEFIISRGNEVSMDDIIKNFDKIPFKWKDVAVIEIVLLLNGRQKYDLVYRNQERFPVKDFVEKSINSSERQVCIVKPLGVLDATIVSRAIEAFKTIFNKNPHYSNTDGHQVTEEIRTQIAIAKKEVVDFRDRYYGRYPFGIAFHKFHVFLSDLEEKRDPLSFLKALSDGVEEGKNLRDKAEKGKDFAGRGLSKWSEIKTYFDQNIRNADNLNLHIQNLADRLSRFLVSEDPADSLREAIKVYEEFKAAVSKETDLLKQDILAIYNQLFEEAEAEALSKNPDSIPDLGKENKLARLSSLTSILELQLEKSKADHFKGDLLSRIYASNAADSGEPEKETTKRIKVSRIKSVIKNQTELDAFVAELHTRLQAILKENQTIIIE